MATYNGARFVAEQLASILNELEPIDSVVIVDDASTDDTVAIVRGFNDPRVRLLRQQSNRGYVRTFERAMSEATGTILFLADQDDVWVPGRRQVLVEAVRHRAVAASNLVLLGSESPLLSPIRGRPWFLRRDQSAQGIRNELRILGGVAPYFGCAMAVRRDFLSQILPFPAFLIESHDLWIATVANVHRQMQHAGDVTIRRRIHDSNTSPSRPRGIRSVLRARWMLLRALKEAARRRASWP